MFGKIAAVFAFLKNKSLQASKPQLIGEKWLMACKVGGITYVLYGMRNKCGIYCVPTCVASEGPNSIDRISCCFTSHKRASEAITAYLTQTTW
jgi:hypothetical protein